MTLTSGSTALNSWATILLLASAASVNAFTNTIFQESVTAQRTAPSKIEGVEIELPDFDELFGRIQQVSPLARVAMQRAQSEDKRGFLAADYDSKFDSFHVSTSQSLVDTVTNLDTLLLFIPTEHPEMKWKTVESNQRKTIHHIEKIDNFKGLGSPILRFRSSLKGPCVSEIFANLIMTLDERKKWDPQIADVREEYPIHDLDAANIAMGFGKYGDCSRLGVGYCQTKANLGISGREQLTLCGIQDFQDGSTVIWGTEMEDWHNHLLPAGQRHTRAKSHLFSTTLVPTSDNEFDVEYVLQLDIGGNMPTWLTSPIVVETVKNLFRHAEHVFAGEEGSELHQWIENKAREDSFLDRHSILMPH